MRIYVPEIFLNCQVTFLSFKNNFLHRTHTHTQVRNSTTGVDENSSEFTFFYSRLTRLLHITISAIQCLRRKTYISRVDQQITCVIKDSTQTRHNELKYTRKIRWRSNDYYNKDGCYRNVLFTNRVIYRGAWISEDRCELLNSSKVNIKRAVELLFTLQPQCILI